jgi:hypothetical protein
MPSATFVLAREPDPQVSELVASWLAENKPQRVPAGKASGLKSAKMRARGGVVRNGKSRSGRAI